MLHVQLAAGFVLLLARGEALVRGSVAVARRLGVSPLLTGLTLVGFGTSTPEPITSLQAALVGSPGIAVGDVVGGNIYNVLGILGLTALVRPLTVPPEILRLDLWVMLAVTALLIAFSVTGWRLTRGGRRVPRGLRGVYRGGRDGVGSA